MSLQSEHREWLERKFPDQPKDIPAAGMVEEAGELLHCVLKLQQEELWGKDDRYPALAVDFVDAIGDCAIYAVSYCNSVNWDFERLLNFAYQVYMDSTPYKDLMDQCVKLVAYASSCYGEWSEAKLVTFLAMLIHAACWRNVRLGDALQTTWKKVRER